MSLCAENVPCDGGRRASSAARGVFVLRAGLHRKVSKDQFNEVVLLIACLELFLSRGPGILVKPGPNSRELVVVELELREKRSPIDARDPVELLRAAQGP